MSTIYEFSANSLAGDPVPMKRFEGQVLLIVNTASACGFTPQYKGLQELHLRLSPRGLAGLGFPCNQFGGQEPGSNEEIKQFCSSKYEVTFPLFDKLNVKGPEQHPLYTALTGKESPFPGDIKWNFEKVLVGRDGKIIKRWPSKIAPDSEEITKAVETALAAK